MTIKEKYDIIHAHAYVYGLPAKIVGFLTKTPIVYTVNGTMGLDAKRKGILASIERRLVCEIKYNKEISVSHKIFEYPNVNKNIHIIYNGVDLQQYDAIKTAEKYS
ncbi:MAG: glycosyltransferase [Candidatus Peribacteria bacterium]|jgi:hypothetical protein|nr:glycosyltransferase [Candidatus Peribacteria bacterium]